MGLLAILALGSLPAAAQEASEAETLRRLIAVSFQARAYAPIPGYFHELAALGTDLSLDDHLLWGKGLEMSGRPLEALRMLSVRVAEHPEHRPLLREVAQLAVQARRFDDAVALYARLSALEPDAPAWPLARARALTWGRRSREAEEILERILHERPDRRDPELLRALADAKLGRGRHAEAARLFEELSAARPGDEELARGWIAALARSGETAAAGERLGRLRALRPEDPVLTLLAGDLAMLRRRYADAAALYEAAAAQGAPARATRAKLARALISDGRVLDGARLFDRLEWEDPLDWEIRREKARLLAWKGSAADALHEYDRLIAAFPGRVSLQVERRAKAAILRGDAARAMAEYEELLLLDPENDQALGDLADLYARQDRWDEARRTYLQAQERDPANPAPRENLEALEARREAIDVRLTSLFSDQQSEEREIDVRRASVGAAAGRFLSDALRLEGSVAQEEWGFAEGATAGSLRSGLRLDLAQHPAWSATLDVGWREYDVDVKAQLLLDGRLRTAPLAGLDVEAFVTREDFSKNAGAFFEELYAGRGGFTLTSRISERLTLDLTGAAGSVTDGNGFWSGEGRARYLLSGEAGRVEGRYRARHEGFREETELYFSPDRFSRQGLGLAWRLDWDAAGKPASYLELGYELGFDDGATIEHGFEIGHRSRLARAVHLGVDAKAVLGQVYEEKRAELFVSVSF